MDPITIVAAIGVVAGSFFVVGVIGAFSVMGPETKEPSELGMHLEQHARPLGSKWPEAPLLTGYKENCYVEVFSKYRYDESFKSTATFTTVRLLLHPPLRLKTEVTPDVTKWLPFQNQSPFADQFHVQTDRVDDARSFLNAELKSYLLRLQRKQIMASIYDDRLVLVFAEKNIGDLEVKFEHMFEFRSHVLSSHEQVKPNRPDGMDPESVLRIEDRATIQQAATSIAARYDSKRDVIKGPMGSSVEVSFARRPQQQWQTHFYAPFSELARCLRIRKLITGEFDPGLKTTDLDFDKRVSVVCQPAERLEQLLTPEARKQILEISASANTFLITEREFIAVFNGRLENKTLAKHLRTMTDLCQRFTTGRISSQSGYR